MVSASFHNFLAMYAVVYIGVDPYNDPYQPENVSNVEPEDAIDLVR